MDIRKVAVVGLGQHQVRQVAGQAHRSSRARWRSLGARPKKSQETSSKASPLPRTLAKPAAERHVGRGRDRSRQAPRHSFRDPLPVPIRSPREEVYGTFRRPCVAEYSRKYLVIICKTLQFCKCVLYKLKGLIRGFCSNVATSDHAHILHTGVFEGGEFNKKGFMHGSPPVQKLLTISIVNDLI